MSKEILIHSNEDELPRLIAGGKDALKLLIEAESFTFGNPETVARAKHPLVFQFVSTLEQALAVHHLKEKPNGHH